MKEEIKKMKHHIYKHLPTYGFIGAFCLIGLAVLYFNHLWTALGENPKTQLLPQVTKDYEEFKDHATLIIALIAATGSILSSLIIILFYDSWKDQKNYDLNKEILLSIDNIIFEIYNDLFKRINCLTVLHEIDKNKIHLENYDENKFLSNYVNELNQLQSKIELYDALNNKNLKNHVSNFGGSIFKVVSISKTIYDSYEKFSKKIEIKKINNTLSERYTNNEKLIFKSEIEAVKKAMSKKHRYHSLDYSIVTFLNFDEAFIEFKNEYNTITEEIRKNLRA